MTHNISTIISYNYHFIYLKSYTILYRYRIQIRVVDHTSSASFFLFDTDVTKLIPTSAYQMRERLDGDPNAFPEELNDLNGHKILLAFSVSQFNLDNNNQVYTIKKISKDDIIIDTFVKLFTLDNVCNHSTCPI